MKRQRPSAKNNVRFGDGAKAHDGLCPASACFNEHMRDVFGTVVRPNGDTTVSIAARRGDLETLQHLRLMLVDLIERCESSTLGRAAILNKGGSCAASVLRVHNPYLQTHVAYLDTVMGKVRAFNDRRAEQVEQKQSGSADEVQGANPAVLE